LQSAIFSGNELDIYKSGSGTNSGGFGVVMSNGKNAVVEEKTWRNNEAILHFVVDSVHSTLKYSN